MRIRPALRVQIAATRFRVPDVAVLDRAHPTEPLATKPSIAVFEILSPEDTLRRLKPKLEDYSTMGISQIWVVDPEDQSFSRYKNGELKRSATFTDTSRGIEFEMAEIKALLD